ncbi:DUF2254 domain-containing protein [Streptomyces wedmorensis]|uniref:DUF2254 domain-containing protein n=1 Tax=Streptomyces wedmorensis TaxID=43759 RepID=UPI0037AB4CA8
MTIGSSQERPQVRFHRRRDRRRELAQLACAILGVALGLLMPLADAGPQIEAGRAVNLLFTVGFGVISLVSIIYSMLFLVVQFSASTFSPRLGIFRDDPIVWRSFAFAVGVFVFSITAGIAIGVRERVSLLIPALAAVLVLIALGFLRTLQTRAFRSIQLAPALAGISARGHQLVDDWYQHPTTSQPQAPPPSHQQQGRVVRCPVRTAVLQQIDVPLLLAAAQRADCRIEFRVPIGTSVHQGTELAILYGGDVPDEELHRALVFGVERTFDQDPLFPARLLADITLRALSKAINDPATAVQALDQLEALLVRLADRQLDIGRITDGAGVVRVVVPMPTWEDFLATALDEPLTAAEGSPMVLLRIRALLRTLLTAAPTERHAALQTRQARLEHTGTQRHPLQWSAGQVDAAPPPGHA